MTELFVPFVNSLLEETPKVFPISTNSRVLSSLATLQQDDYPEDLKNLIFLSSIICAMMSNEANEPLSMILESSACQWLGNSNCALLGLNWVQLCSWFRGNLVVFGAEFRPRVLSVILDKVYQSGKTLAEFECEGPGLKVCRIQLFLTTFKILYESFSCRKLKMGSKCPEKMLSF